MALLEGGEAGLATGSGMSAIFCIASYLLENGAEAIISNRVYTRVFELFTKTLKHFKKEIWISQMIDRQDYLGWQAEGGKTLKDKAGEKVRWILENHKPTPPLGSVQKQVKLIVRGVDEKRRKAAS